MPNLTSTVIPSSKIIVYYILIMSITIIKIQQMWYPCAQNKVPAFNGQQLSLSHVTSVSLTQAPF